ncbi:hypothetical protein SAMN05421810_102363 [Amycolatopsis arida]|uniref:DUF6542 domain-containing protein n=1 Tax=Amycolatopsis arida TaxID=587909 RepID=A0A1I5PQD4_9PSEU|nr:DUF6542 domain-containing protein [Amycolatopsis arida]TDX98570.1 hypothetical protein CLV69_101363 [Amycolatopsis arida]SFP36225.1 hypothetical protein SAMN05421810_102363 [Amycolatopsis arida]
MTAVRDHERDPEATDGPVPWDQRLIAGDRRGLPWWGAVLLAFGLAVLGAVVGQQFGNPHGLLFQVCYFLGAVAAVAAVRRRNLFGPMVQPPLVMAVTVPGMVLLGPGLPANSDTLAKVLAIGRPLINGFPAMAITTAVTVGIGVYRMFRERDPNAPVKVRDSAGKRVAKPQSKGAKGPVGRSPAGADDRDRGDVGRRDRPGGPRDAEVLGADGRRAEGRRPDGRRDEGRRGGRFRGGRGDGDGVDERDGAGRGGSRRTGPHGRVAPAERSDGRGRPAVPGRGAAEGTAGSAGARRPRADDGERRGRGAANRDAGAPGGTRGEAPGGAGGAAGGRAVRDQSGRAPRQRRSPRAEGADPRRGSEGWADPPPEGRRPRRPARADDPAAGDPGTPRRRPRGGGPVRGRPWDEEPRG